MRKSMTFNGIRKPWLYLLEGRQKSPFPPVRNNLIRVTGMAGAHVSSKETDVLYIQQPIGFIADTDEQFLERKDELAEWLNTNEAVPLQFDDEPGRTYYAEIEGTIEDFTKFSNQRRGIITFLCADPYSYGEEKTLHFPSDQVIVENNGTAEADPIFELTATQKTTFAMISNEDDEYNLIGQPTDVESIVVDKSTTMLDEIGDTLKDWNDATGSTGNFIKGSSGIQVQSYGTGTDWHGPRLIKEIDPTQDFQLDFFVNVRTERADQPFRITTNLYDENMNELSMLRLWDKSTRRVQKIAEARVGPFVDQYHNYLISDRNYNVEGQRVWNGLLRVTREGNAYKFYVARISQAGNHIETISQRYIDVKNEFMGRLKFIRFDVAKFGSENEPNEIGINRIKVQKLATLEVDQTPYILDIGDVVTFDHKNNDILVNGEARKDLKNFGASFFTLKKGENQLLVTPENSFETNVRFRERFY